MKYVQELLEAEWENLEARLRAAPDPGTRAGLVRQKDEVKRALTLLRRCEAFGIGPHAVFRRLPEQRVQTPSSAYRIVEDCESDDPLQWREARFPDEPGGRVFLCQGDVVVEPAAEDRRHGGMEQPPSGRRTR